MELDEIINLILLPFGGISVALVAMVGFLAHLSTKRIVNGELANHKLQLQGFRSESQKELQHIKDIGANELQYVKDSGAKEIESLKQQYTADIERIKAQLQSEFLKYETYTTISKEIYQELFTKRIKVYEKLLNLKKEIDQSLVDNADFLEIHDDDPSPFTNVLSNELAALSAELVEKSNKIFSDAKVESFYAEVHNQGNNNIHEIVMEAENYALRKMFTECGDVYKKWFLQLNKDASKIRSVLDLSGEFLERDR